MDYLTYLDADFTRLRALVAATPDAPVPTCPPWTMNDLGRHVAEVYLDKTLAMTTGVEPQWPLDLPADPLDTTYRGLLAEFAKRDPADPTVTWYTPDQTVGFWVRRMAHETVIHRIDAEAGAGVPSEPVSDELAVDGIDEVLVCFLAFAANQYAEHLGEPLKSLHGKAIRIESGGSTWVIRFNDTVTVETDGDADAIITAAPDPMLRWLWRRAPQDGVNIKGDNSAADALFKTLKAATQ